MKPLWPYALLVCALAAASLLVAACGDDEEEAVQEEEVRGSGNVVSEQMAFTDFTAIDVSNAFMVDIVPSDSFSVTIRVDDNILDLLDVSKAGDTLRIGLEPGVNLRGDVTLEASITMPDLEGLELSGASKVDASGLQLSEQLDIEASGASTVVLKGSAAELTINGSGASSLDLADFTVDTAEVTLSGASEATVNVQERIDAVDVSGASRLRYLGDPTLSDVRTSGASTVEKIGG